MKIASLLPSATEIVCALGLENDLVGITHECDFPLTVVNKPHLTASRISHETMSSKEIDHAVRTQLDGHGSIYDLNEKLLHKFQPDLVLTQELCDVCAVSYKMVSKAAKTYFADSQVVSLEPNTLSDILENVKTVGQLCNVSDKANEVVTELENRLNNVREKTKSVQFRPKVMMLEWLEPAFAPGHWVPEQVEIAGGICLLGESGKPSVTITYQQIIDSNPDILVLIPCGYYTSDILRQLPNTIFPSEFQQISAIEKSEVWALDATSYFSRPAPRVVDGVEILAKILHPKIFGSPFNNEAVRVSKNLLKFTK
jgi:iron complex transport system substrate-binding protein